MVIKNIEKLLNSGIIIIDKPSHISSLKLTTKVKDILNVNKVGHAGTLDPLATGVLPIALNKATKVIDYLTIKNKVYKGKFKLGKKYSKKDIQNVFDEFVGIIDQLPPRKSAVKRRVRERRVYYFKVTNVTNNIVDFEVKCQAGTYIRALARDISKDYFSCRLIDLRRTAVGHITIGQANTVNELEKASKLGELKNIIKPIEEVIDIPKIVVLNKTVHTLYHGAPLFRPGIKSIEDDFDKDDVVGLYNEEGKLIEIAKALYNSKKLKSMNKGMVAKPVRVLN